jgi:hypothetical protein
MTPKFIADNTRNKLVKNTNLGGRKKNDQLTQSPRRKAGERENQATEFSLMNNTNEGLD